MYTFPWKECQQPSDSRFVTRKGLESGAEDSLITTTCWQFVTWPLHFAKVPRDYCTCPLLSDVVSTARCISGRSPDCQQTFLLSGWWSWRQISHSEADLTIFGGTCAPLGCPPSPTPITGCNLQRWTHSSSLSLFWGRLRMKSLCYLYYLTF